MILNIFQVNFGKIFHDMHVRSSGISICLVFLFLLLPVFHATGQIAGKSFVISFSKENYHAGNQNWSVDTGRNGIVYIGNNRGLLRFDGANWDIFHMPDDMVVRSVAAGPDNRVYVGAFEEFGYFSPNKSGSMDYTSLSSLPENESFHNDEIWRILIHRGNVYFQSFSHIYIYDGEKVKVIDPEGTIVLLLEASNRLFIHKVGVGLFELRDDSLIFIEGSQILADDEIKAVLPFGTNAYLVGASSGGLLIMDDNGFRLLDDPVNNMVREAGINNGIALDSFLIIGTIVDGIYILNPDGSLREHLNTDNFLQNNTVLALKAGQGQSFWAGLDRGIDYVSLDNELSFYMDPTRSRRAVYDAALTGDTLWIGTNQGVFRYKYDPSMGYTQPVFVEGTQGQVWDLSEIDGDLYCGHTNGTFLLGHGKPKRISDINGGYEIRKISTRNRDILLQSSYSVFSVYTRAGEQWKFSHAISGFYEPIPNFEVDHYGYIWGAHANKGLYRLRFDPDFNRIESIRYFGLENGLPTERHLQVARVDNRVVFCTRKKIYTYNDLTDSIVPYEQLNRQLGVFAASDRIVGVGNDKYWCIEGNRVALFLIKNGMADRIYSYDLSRAGAYLSTGQNGIAVLKDDLYLLCLDNGFALFSERDTSLARHDIKPIIRMVRTFDRKKHDLRILNTLDDRETELPFYSRNFEFNFSGNRICVSPLFSFRLMGFENQWSDWSPRSKIDYMRLPAGDYEFMVRTLRPDGTASESTTYGIKIRRPWYASLTALIIYGVLFILMILLLRILFIRRVKKHTLRIQTLEKEKRRRDKIIAEQDIVRLKNDKLQAEVSHKNVQLANYTMTILRKNELLIRLRDEIGKQKQDLGGRYPNYHYDHLISLIDSSISSEDDWRIFEMHFDQAHENFFMRLKAKYEELTTSDLKLCAYLRLNLSSKEIAPLLNISVRGVEIRRYRLRKRLFLNTDENLVEFLMTF